MALCAALTWSELCPAAPPGGSEPPHAGKALRSWVQELRDGNEAAAFALARIGKAAVPALVGGLKDEDPHAREAAALALAAIGPDAREAVPALTATLSDRQYRVSRAAAEARRGVPKEQRGGVSIAPIIPFVPLGFWGAALLVDSIAGPWGTLAVGWFHVALGVLFVASIVRNMWSL